MLSAQQAQQQQLIQSVESSSADPSQEKPENKVVIKGKNSANRAHSSKGKKSRPKFQKSLKNSVEYKDTVVEKQEVKTGEIVEPAPNVAETKEGGSKQETCGQIEAVDLKSTEEENQAGVGDSSIVSSINSDTDKTQNIQKTVDVIEHKKSVDEYNPPSDTSIDFTDKKTLCDDGDRDIGNIKDDYDEVSLLESDPEMKDTKAGDVEMLAGDKTKLLKTDDDDDETEIESPVMETTVAE